MANFYVAKSDIQGFGVFCSKAIPKGGFIFRIKGKLHTFRIKSEDDALAYPDWIGIRHNTWIDPAPPGDHINHSCEPSAGIKGTVTVVARRNLKPGDEITLDYSLIEESPLWHMKCRCGAPHCRKVIRSISFLPRKVYEHYLPFVPTYFQHLYRAHARR